MPPVRWKRTAVTILYFIHIALAARTPKDLVDDGWKPIIGHTSNFDAEKYYQSNQNEKASLRDSVAMDTKKSYIVTSPQPITSQSANSIGNQLGHTHLHKMSSTSKQQVLYPSAQGYNPQKPITHRSQTKLHKVPVIGKNHMSVGVTGKRVLKPVRIHSDGYSQKDEVLAQAPSTGLGNYAFFNPALGSIKTRHSHPSTDYFNHFGAQSSDLFQFQRLPIQQYVIPKNQVQSDVRFPFQAQNDEYSRNLVPPPPSKEYTEKEKPKDKLIIFKQKDQINSVTDSPQTQTQSQLLPEATLFQVPPPYQETAYYIPTANQQAVDVQVTQENIKEFHNNVPYQQTQDLAYNSPFANYQFGKKPTETPRIPTYEVTEEKNWHEIPPSYQHFLQEVKKFEKMKRPVVKEQNKHNEPFLPTPMKPFVAIPTSPTQSEISTVFSELSQKINRQKGNLESGFFNVKEVSTHYPVLSRPNVGQFSVQYSVPVYDNEDFPNEITTIKPWEHFKIKENEVSTELQTTTIPTTTVLLDWQQKRRPAHRRRRPINRNKLTTEEPSTTTVDYNYQKDIEETTVKERRRRPVQVQRTTETPVFIEKPTKRMRYRQRIRPTVESTNEEMPHNHKISFMEDISQPIRGSYTYKTSIDNTRKRPIKYYDGDISEDVTEEEEFSTSMKYKPAGNSRSKGRKPYKHNAEDQYEQNDYQLETHVQETSEEVYESNKEASTTKPLFEESTTVITTEKLELVTNVENEDVQNDKITIKEIYTEAPEILEEETTLATTTAASTTTTTTAEPKTTMKGSRFRRPIHYKPPRPKFSVKDYHQRLNQYISSTEVPKVSTESTRPRYRTRRPVLKLEEQQEATEATKRRFIPKSQRQPITSESKDEPMETSAKTINSRIRPFGRHRSTTTEATTTQKISIKPNIFNTHRRPPSASLKERIQNKYNKLNNTEKNMKSEKNEEESELGVATTAEAPQVPTSTEMLTTDKASTTTTVATTTEQEFELENDENEDINEMEIFKNDALMQSQRVSDLTSSTQNQYNTPGMFKNVSPNVRKVPNYFALATEDPILPIEAFFPNLNKEKH